MKFTPQQKAWLLYDPASSAYALVVRTIYAPIFLALCAQGIWAEAKITAIWGMIASIAGVAAGVLSLFAGKFADARKCRVLFLGLFVATAFVSLLLMAFCKLPLALVISLIFLSYLCYMSANSFYDSLLPEIAQPAERDRLSSVGAALGYVGGMIPFLLLLGVTLSCKIAQNTGCVLGFIIAALWWGAGTLPLLFKIRENPALKRKPFKAKETWQCIREHRSILFFLIAYFLYIDGVGSILLVATPMAQGLQIPMKWLLGTILGLQIIAVPFTLLFGKLAERFTAKKMVLFAIGDYVVIAILVGILSALSDLTVRRALFGVVALLIGISQGGIQSLSRSLFSRLIPQDRAAELFGVYNFFGKFTTIVGPVLIALSTMFWNRAEWGIVLMIVPFLAGAWMLSRIEFPEEKR